MKEREEFTIKLECQETNSNRQELVALSADSVDQGGKVSLVSRDSMINLDSLVVKVEKVAILSVIFSKNSRNSSVQEEDNKEVRPEEHNSKQKVRI